MSTRNKQPLEPFGYYHIYNRAVGAERLFYSDRDYEAFMERIPRYLLQCFELYSYCLLPNHFHFCVKTGDVDTDKASKAFSDFSNSYCKWFNLKHSRKGGLFMRPFKRKKLSHDAYFTRFMRLVERAIPFTMPLMMMQATTALKRCTGGRWPPIRRS